MPRKRNPICDCGKVALKKDGSKYWVCEDCREMDEDRLHHATTDNNGEFGVVRRLSELDFSSFKYMGFAGY